jgi:hypothetical protein
MIDAATSPGRSSTLKVEGISDIEEFSAAIKELSDSCVGRYSVAVNNEELYYH